MVVTSDRGPKNHSTDGEIFLDLSPGIYSKNGQNSNKTLHSNQTLDELSIRCFCGINYWPTLVNIGHNYKYTYKLWLYILQNHYDQVIFHEISVLTITYNQRSGGGKGRVVKVRKVKNGLTAVLIPDWWEKVEGREKMTSAPIMTLTWRLLWKALLVSIQNVYRKLWLSSHLYSQVDHGGRTCLFSREILDPASFSEDNYCLCSCVLIPPRSNLNFFLYFFSKFLRLIYVCLIPNARCSV